MSAVAEHPEYDASEEERTCKRESCVFVLVAAFSVVLFLIMFNWCDEDHRKFELEFISDKIARCKGPGFSRTVQMEEGAITQDVGYVLLPWLLVALFPVLIIAYDQAVTNLLKFNGEKYYKSELNIPLLVLCSLLEVASVTSFLLLVYWNTNDSEQSEEHYGATTVLFVVFLLQTLLLLWELRQAIAFMNDQRNKDEGDREACCTSAAEMRGVVYAIAFLLLPFYFLSLFLFALSRAAVWEYFIVFSWTVVLLLHEFVWHEMRHLHEMDSDIKEWLWEFVDDWLALLGAAALIVVPILAPGNATVVLVVTCGVVGVVLYPWHKVQRVLRKDGLRLARRLPELGS